MMINYNNNIFLTIVEKFYFHIHIIKNNFFLTPNIIKQGTILYVCARKKFLLAKLSCNMKFFCALHLPNCNTLIL